MKKILLIEDDVDYGKIVTTLLRQEGYAVDFATTSVDGIKYMKENRYDLVLCDLRLDQFSGLQILEIMRLEKRKSKFIILTSSISDDDEVKGLQLGIDDYIRKTSAFQVLFQRIARVLALPEEACDDEFRIVNMKEHLTIDLANKYVYKDDVLVHLSLLEYRLLVFLLEHKNETLTREQIIEATWGTITDLMNPREVDTYIKKIRQKLNLDSILSVRGIGYRWHEKQ